jgi:hypothetical protein
MILRGLDVRKLTLPLKLNDIKMTFMKILTVTKARQNLGEWLHRAVEGEDIGIIDSASGSIIALRPVEVYSEGSRQRCRGLLSPDLRPRNKSPLLLFRESAFYGAYGCSRFPVLIKVMVNAICSGIFLCR